MALVKGPFFATWASGSFGKVLTVRWLGKPMRFVFAKYKSRAGKRSQMQIDNAEIFGNRMRVVNRLREMAVYGTAKYGIDIYFKEL